MRRVIIAIIEGLFDFFIDPKVVILVFIATFIGLCIKKARERTIILFGFYAFLYFLVCPRIDYGVYLPQLLEIQYKLNPVAYRDYKDLVLKIEDRDAKSMFTLYTCFIAKEINEIYRDIDKFARENKEPIYKIEEIKEKVILS